jgi:hypothetical protein
MSAPTKPAIPQYTYIPELMPDHTVYQWLDRRVSRLPSVIVRITFPSLTHQVVYKDSPYTNVSVSQDGSGFSVDCQRPVLGYTYSAVYTPANNEPNQYDPTHITLWHNSESGLIHAIAHMESGGSSFEVPVEFVLHIWLNRSSV